MVTRGTERGNQTFSPDDPEKDGGKHVEMAEEDTTNNAFDDVNA